MYLNNYPEGQRGDVTKYFFPIKSKESHSSQTDLIQLIFKVYKLIAGWRTQKIYFVCQWNNVIL